jgi:hypothetical protein
MSTSIKKTQTQPQIIVDPKQAAPAAPPVNPEILKQIGSDEQCSKKSRVLALAARGCDADQIDKLIPGVRDGYVTSVLRAAGYKLSRGRENALDKYANI